MPDGLIETAAQAAEPVDRRIYGIVVAQVINNVDVTGLGRVQLHLPWLPEFEPWARVAVPMAGSNRGAFFIPQVGEEVLCAFNHGDIREAYVIGSLWNDQDRPPSQLPTDSINKRMIRTPQGHQIEFNDLDQSITITSSTQQTIEMNPEKIEISTAGGTATLKLDSAGNISIQSTLNLELKATNISIEGQMVDIKSSARTSVNAGGFCEIQGGLVKIN